MSLARTYSQNSLEYVKQVYLEQLHLAVLAALNEKRTNYQASSAAWFAKLPMGDLVRGWRLDRAKVAPEPQVLSVGQKVDGSELLKTLEYMSYDSDFDGIADLVKEINNLEIASGIVAWSTSLYRLSAKAKPTIAGLRFVDLAQHFMPPVVVEKQFMDVTEVEVQKDLKGDVEQVIEKGRSAYETQILKKAYPFSESQKAANVFRKTYPLSSPPKKSSSCSIFSCFNFFSKPRYQEVRVSDAPSPSRPRQKPIGESVAESKHQELVMRDEPPKGPVDTETTNRAMTIFAQYFDAKGMRTAWQLNASDNEISNGLKAQHQAAKQVMALLSSASTMGAIFEKIAELMYDATQRQGFGRFFRSSQFARALKSVAVVLAGACSGDAQFVKQLEMHSGVMWRDLMKDQKRLQYSEDRLRVLKGLTTVLTPKEKEVWRLNPEEVEKRDLDAYELLKEYGYGEGELTAEEKAETLKKDLPECQDDIAKAKVAMEDVKRWEGINKCFNSILSAIKASKALSSSTSSSTSSSELRSGC